MSRTNHEFVAEIVLAQRWKLQECAWEFADVHITTFTVVESTPPSVWRLLIRKLAGKLIKATFRSEDLPKRLM